MTGAVTVVIPTHDRAALVPRAVRSALAQRDVELEVIVVDDGSRDATREVLGALAADGANVTVVRHDAPRGVATARNAGVERAAKPWVAFLDDDDVWAPTKLACQLAAIDA